MLYVVFILAFAGFIALAVWGFDKYSALGCVSSIVGIAGTIIFGIVMVFSTIGIINENVYSDALYEKYTTRKATLEWRLEQDYTDNDAQPNFMKKSKSIMRTLRAQRLIARTLG